MPQANEVKSPVQTSVPPTAPPMPPLPGMTTTPPPTVTLTDPSVHAPHHSPAPLTIADLQAQLAAAQAAAAPATAPTAAAFPPVAPSLPPLPSAPAPQAVPHAMPTHHPHAGVVPVIEMQMTPAPDAQVQSVTPQLDLGIQMNAMSNPSGGGVDILKGYDLSQVQTSNFRLLPTDVSFYEGRITKAELGKSSTGFPQIKLTVKTCYPTQYGGVTINDYVTIQPATMWKYKSLLEATGLLSPDGARFAGSSMADFVGKIVQFQVKHDAYNGENRNKISGGYSAASATEEVAHQPLTAGFPGGAPAVNWG